MKIVGHSQPIHDAVSKVAGTVTYAADMQLPGMLYAALVKSTIPHGYVEDIDFSEADQVPGVVGRLSCLEEHGAPFCRYRTIKGQNTADQEYVFNRHVRFIGDRVGCILAKTQEAARTAAKKVRVTYKEYPAALTVEESLAGKIEGIHPEGYRTPEVDVEVGKLPEGEYITIETETHLARINHAAMEPHVCTAAYDRHTGQLTLWSPSQSVHGIRTVIGDIFGMPYHKVRVVKSTMGGSFGGKQEWVTEPVAAAAAIYMKCPVQLALDRDEVFLSTVCRAPMDMKLKGLYREDGTLLSFQLDNTLNAGAYLGNSKDYTGAIANKFFRCYKYPHMKYTARAVITNTPVSGAFRGWTSPELATALEHNMNMAARKLGMDPIELRLKNAARPGDMDIRLEQSLGEIRLAECLELGREKFRWETRRREDEEWNRTNRRYRRGTAVACGGHLNGYFPRMNDFTGMDMRMTETGNVLVNATIHDHGCGTVAALRMIVGEVLELDSEMIQVGEGDTAVTPFDYGCFSSRSTYVIGRAAQDCAQMLADRMKGIVNRLYGIPTDELEVNDGALVEQIPVRTSGIAEKSTMPGIGESRRFSYAEIVQASHDKLQEEVTAHKQYINQSNPGVTGAHFAQVEVDTYTGDVKILDYLAVHDIGKAINPDMCLGQIRGAVVMGAGAALTEQVIIDRAGKAIDSLSNYHLLNAPEIPEIKVELVEDGETDGPFESKSIGEVCNVPPAAAIVGAVNQALQADMCSIPVSRDKICEWVEKNQSL